MRFAIPSRIAGLAATAAMAVVALSACGSTSTPSAGATCPDSSKWHLVQSGQLTDVTDTTYKPAEFADPKNPGSFTGYDIDLINEIGKRMCLQTKVITGDFSSIIDSISGPTLGQQRYDISISSFTINDDRLKKVNMIPYYQAGESLLVPKGNPKNFQKVSDLCGHIVAVQDGTVEKDELTDANGDTTKGSGQTPDCKTNKIRLQINADQDVVVQTLLNGQADASYQDQPVTAYYAAQNADKLSVGGITVAPAPQGIVVRKDNPDFENAVRTALKAMVADGTYLNILKKWGNDSGAYTTGL
jgi:polar amino acid transport system substrate-binding protein